MGMVTGQGWMLGLISGKNMMERFLENIANQRMGLMQSMNNSLSASGGQDTGANEQLKNQDGMLELVQKQYETKLKYIMQQIESVQKIIDENIKLSKFDIKV